jgi:aminoglycoside phosphotransferase family enzyme/predicted kinase
VELSALIEALSRPEAYPHPVAEIEIHQTHISVVFLAGPFAYKIKKPVNLGFLDFTTLEKRKHFCEEEVRLNLRLAPQVYLEVVPIIFDPDAQARVAPSSLACASGSEAVVEWAVKMKRLPAAATLECRLERDEVTPAHLHQLAQRLAEFHRRADANDRISEFGRFAVVADNARENFTQCQALVGVTVSPAVFERVRALTQAHLARLQDLIETRAKSGVARDTHGDLHLDHVYLFPEEAPPNDLVMIDCIEFTDRFRYADPVADVAFLAMDLTFHGRRDLARVMADEYFRATSDVDGRGLLPFYAAYRAVVRAKVKGMELGEAEIDPAERADAALRARAHWLVALGELEQPGKRPALLLIAGLPGSGKSTLAKSLSANGDFHVLRSDVIRKEISKSEHGNIYTEAWTERTYSELLRRAEELLWKGERVIVDANYRQDVWRVRFLGAARTWGVPCVFLHCHAAPDVLRQRLQTRTGDVSDADWKVYQELEASWQPSSPPIERVAFTVDTTPGLADYESRVRAKLIQEGLLE